MYPDVSLAVGMALPENVLQTVSVSGDDCTLQCSAKAKPGVQYMAVRWYKFIEPPSRRRGLLTKDLPNGTTQWYATAEREVELLESHSIFLPNLTCADSGTYICHLVAPVGEQIQEGQVVLTLADCDPESPTEELYLTDACMVIIATVVLICSLVIFRLSYVSLKNTLKEENKKKHQKETLLDAPLKPLEKKDLMLIYTLGPKMSKTPTLKHICV
ncbi:CD83 antigen [Symphorus nematophorus]